jgi:murein DD-endopeptidase MepM/ murein hydrolase activator NlpD
MRSPSSSRLVLAAALFTLLSPAVSARPSPAIGSAAPKAKPSYVSTAEADVAIDRLLMLRDRAGRSADADRTRQVRPAQGALTGWWGELRRGHRHTGVDMDGETGDAVVAAMRGVVSHAGSAPAGFSGYGQMVVIDHGGFQTLYAHLSRIDVAVGQRLVAGAGVGAVGTTGSVTGSHLHFEVLVGGRPVDPATVIHVL